ncbi:MAG TPA: YciI family protein [Blastocatellia bacterium]|nr:YciI family protein [Blastocatellia bacterium]
MKFLLLVHHNEEVLDKLNECELQQMRSESVQLAKQLDECGQYLDAGPLHSVETATCVRVRGCKRSVSDEPFAETREQLCGYFFINVPDLDQAIDIAAQVPGARIGTVEVRPVIEIEGLPKQ